MEDKIKTLIESIDKHIIIIDTKKSLHECQGFSIGTLKGIKIILEEIINK